MGKHGHFEIPVYEFEDYETTREHPSHSTMEASHVQSFEVDYNNALNVR